MIGDSLKTIFIEDCYKTDHEKAGVFATQKSFYSEFFNDSDRTVIVLKFLSRTSENQAVIPFLDIETKEVKKLKMAILAQEKVIENFRFTESKSHYSDGYTRQKRRLNNLTNRLNKNKSVLDTLPVKTLQALLLQQFTDVCFNQGKGFDLALQHINQLYIDSIYV